MTPAGLYNLHKKGFLPKPNILWHEKMENIHLKLQSQSLHRQFFTDGFVLLPKVDFETLLNAMRSVDADARRKKLLFDSIYDHSTSSILNHWRQNMPLIPPSFFIHDQQYSELIRPVGFTSNELYPLDGRHRLNAAYYFGEKEIPVLVWKRQAEQIQSILKM
jgi:hypothetical protein